jgi:hypothetical protein
VAAASVLAACGGDDSDEPTPDFPAVADEVCAENAAALADVRGEAGRRPHPPATRSS